MFNDSSPKKKSVFADSAPDKSMGGAMRDSGEVRLSDNRQKMKRGLSALFEENDDDRTYQEMKRAKTNAQP